MFDNMYYALKIGARSRSPNKGNKYNSSYSCNQKQNVITEAFSERLVYGALNAGILTVKMRERRQTVSAL